MPIAMRRRKIYMLCGSTLDKGLRVARRGACGGASRPEHKPQAAHCALSLRPCATSSLPSQSAAAQVRRLLWRQRSVESHRT
eukprot:6012638-Pleurochrysis_carterae.AAC.2